MRFKNIRGILVYQRVRCYSRYEHASHRETNFQILIIKIAFACNFVQTLYTLELDIIKSSNS